MTRQCRCKFDLRRNQCLIWICIALGVLGLIVGGVCSIRYAKIHTAIWMNCIPAGYWTRPWICGGSLFGGEYRFTTFAQFSYVLNGKPNIWGLKMGCTDDPKTAIEQLKEEYPPHKPFLCAWSDMTHSLWLEPSGNLTTKDKYIPSDLLGWVIAGGIVFGGSLVGLALVLFVDCRDRKYEIR